MSDLTELYLNVILMEFLYSECFSLLALPCPFPAPLYYDSNSWMYHLVPD